MTLAASRILWSSAARTLVASAAVVALTWVCYVLRFDVTTTALLDLIAIVLWSLGGSFLVAAIASIVATLSINYFLVTPSFSFRPAHWLDLAALVAFLTTALVITRLLSQVRGSLREAQRARDELRVAIDTIPALVWTTLPDGSSDFSNRRWLEYTGLSREQARDWGYKGSIHPEDYEQLLPEWSARYSAGEPIEDEARLRRADGEYLWFMHRAVPLRDPQGNIVKWYGTSTDIEESKRAAEALREQAQLLDLTHDTVIVRDLDDAITYWNRGAQEQYGWTSEEAIGQVTHTLLKTVFPRPVEQIVATLRKTGRWEGELVHTRRDGTRVVVASRWSLQRDGEGHPLAVLETNNDVTERRRAEDALRRSEAYLAEAQRLSHTGSWAWNLRHPEKHYTSPEVYRILGLDADRAPAGGENALQDRVHPEDLPRLGQTTEIALADKSDFELELRAVRPDGSIRRVYLLGHPVLDAQGEVAEVVGTVMDVTERRQAERAVRRARERALRARFDAMLDERTRLAREIHDTLLQGFTGVALKLVAAVGRFGGSPDATSALQDVVSLAQKTLVDARRAVWDLRNPAPEEGDFATGLRALAEGVVHGTELSLQFDVAGTPRLIQPNVQAAVGRVVQEALTNVVKHASAHAVRVHLSFEDRGVVVSVKDDGRGFATDPGFQSYGGHWGLLGMRERVAQIRGRLKVRSTPGHGTIVVLLVPYTAHRPDRAEVTSPAS